MDRFQTDERSFSSRHPILSLLLNQDDPTPPTIDVSVLGDFVDYSLRAGSRPGFVPHTLTEFYGEYLSFSIVQYLQKHRRRSDRQNLLWDIDSTIKRLAKLAYLSKIKGTAITRSLLLRILHPEKGNCKDTLQVEWKLLSFGLLEEVVEVERGKTGVSIIIGQKSRKVNRLKFMEDDQLNDEFYDDDDADDDDDHEDDDESDKNSEQEDLMLKNEKKQGRWLAITGRFKRKSTPEAILDHPRKLGNDRHMPTAHGTGVRDKVRHKNRNRKLEKQKYRFKERGVEEFLVARHHFQKCVEKCSIDGILLTTSMRRSIRQLPVTGDIWRMTMGLLGKSNKTSELVKGVLAEIIEECKLRRQMTPFDITSLCIEAVYESGNATDLADILEEFTFNQTVNYSTSTLPRHRLAYAVSAVGYLVRTCRSVYGVHLAYLRLDCNTIAMLADPLNVVSDNHIQVLNLSGNFELGASAVRRLMRFLVKASHLTHLDLSGCQIGDQGLRLLSQFFECWPLQFLRVSGNGITDIGVPSLARNFKFVPTLEWLDLSDNRITDRTAAILAASLPVLPQLRSLDLRRNLLGDFGTDVLTRGLGCLLQITSLVLAENQIGERGASALARNLWKTKSLRYVNISLNNIPSSSIVGLRRAASSRGSLRVNAEVQHKSAVDLASVASSTDHVYLIGEGEEDRGGYPESDEEEADGTDEKRGDWKSMSDFYKSVDLLAGRRDDAPLSERKKGLKPRRGPLTRSWHGLNESIRSSLRRSKMNADDTAD